MCKSIRKKIVAVVETNLPDGGNMLDKQNPMCQQIADNVVTFLLQEMAHAHPPQFLPLQSGVGNINNAVMARLGENPEIPPFMMYSEMLQESVVHLLETGKISGASASSLTISADSLRRFTTIWITLPAALCCVRRRFPITRKSSVVRRHCSERRPGVRYLRACQLNTRSRGRSDERHRRQR